MFILRARFRLPSTHWEEPDTFLSDVCECAEGLGLSRVSLKQTCELVKFCLVLKSSLLVDDLELVSLFEAQVAVMVGFMAVYSHHQVVCQTDIVKRT